METAKSLAIKVLSKTLDMTKLTAEKGRFDRLLKIHYPYTSIYFSVEMATLQRIDNKTVIRILTNKEVEALIGKYEKEEAAAEAAKKEQKQKA